MRLKGKVVILTGVAGGIGRAFAKALVKEGAKLCISDIKPFDVLTKELEKAGGERYPWNSRKPSGKHPPPRCLPQPLAANRCPSNG